MKLKKGNVVLLLILLILVGFMVWRFINISSPDEFSVDGEGTIEVAEQNPGQLGATLDRVELSTNGFVVIKGVVNDRAGLTVGVSRLLRAGVHEDVQVLMELVPGQEYEAVLYADNGNGVFDDLEDTELDVAARFLVEEDEDFIGK